MLALKFARAARCWNWPVCLLLAKGVHLGLARLLAACYLPPLATPALVLVTWARRRRRAQPSHWRGPEGGPTEIVVSRGD